MATTVKPLRDVLYELSLAKPVPDTKVLDDFVQLYPEYSVELTNFAIELVMDALSGEPENIVESSTIVTTAVSRAMSRFQNKLYAVEHAQTDNLGDRFVNAQVENPFAELDRAAFRSLAHRLNVNTVFLMKLRDRQIDPSTMTKGFCQHVADKSQVPLDVIVTHFAAQSNEQVNIQYFKANQKPKVGAKQSFDEAVRSSRLTTDQQHYLLGL